MSRHLERDLASLDRELLLLSSMTEEMIDKACVALIRKEVDLAAEVIRSDAQIDEREVRIEDDCLKILALHHPVATDLRRTAAILKINNDLERIADLAVNIAERAEQLILNTNFKVPQVFGEMAALARSMVRTAIDAFVKLDPSLARSVCSRDDELDRMHKEFIDSLCRMVQQQPDTVDSAFNLFSASRQLERIGDHATNICEDVIYLVEGEIARHRQRAN
jgi:phosphate transport system protein